MSENPYQTGKTGQLWCKKRQLKEIAPYENEVQYLCEFKKVLDEHIQDIGIEDSGAPYMGHSYIEWDHLQCKKCEQRILKTDEYLEHILHCQFTEKDVRWYKKYGVVPKQVDEVLTEAQELRASTSYLAKNCINTTDVRCKIPLNSPLITYFTRGMAVYFDRMPTNLERVIPGELHVGTKTYNLYFTAKIIERQRANVMRIQNELTQKKLDRELRRTIPKCSVPVDDVVLSAEKRTKRQRRALNTALGFPKKKHTKQADIMGRIREMFPNMEEKKPVEIPEVLPEIPPTKTTKTEKRRLDSSLTSDFMKPALSKRKSVFKTRLDL